MKPFKSLSAEEIRQRTQINRMKIRVGMAYGMVAGLAFAISTWGIDGFRLSLAHAFYPWLKFILGAVICTVIGGIAGWLVARLEKGLFALLIYLGVAFIFSRLSVGLPFQIFPDVVARLDPETGNLLNYVFYEESFNSRFAITMLWVSLFTVLVGILQIPLAEPAAFATSFFGKAGHLLVCAMLMLISGSIVDNLSNEPLRLAVLSTDNTIQFVVDHQGQEVDRDLARSMHVSSLRPVEEVIDQPRRLIVRSYDQWLGQINVLVRFGDTWVDCSVVYNQPSFCEYVTAN
jgi:hypothetical protein